MKTIIPILLLSLITCYFTACVDECDPPIDRPVRSIFVWFNDSDGLNNMESVRGIGNNAFISQANNSLAQQIYELPLSPNEDSVAFVFQRSSKIDTIVVTYQRATLFQSDWCGYQMVYSNFALPYSTFNPVIWNEETNEDGFVAEIDLRINL